MKKLFAMVMAVAAISFASCGNKTEKAECEDTTACACKCDTCKCDPCQCGEQKCCGECPEKAECPEAAAAEAPEAVEAEADKAAREAIDKGQNEASKGIEKGAEAAKKKLGL